MSLTRGFSKNLELQFYSWCAQILHDQKNSCHKLDLIKNNILEIMKFDTISVNNPLFFYTNSTTQLKDFLRKII
jgi:hypothetical protein